MSEYNFKTKPYAHQLEALKQKLSNAEHDKERAENKKNIIKIELDSVVKQKTEIDVQNRKLESMKNIRCCLMIWPKHPNLNFPICVPCQTQPS